MCSNWWEDIYRLTQPTKGYLKINDNDIWVEFPIGTIILPMQHWEEGDYIPVVLYIGGETPIFSARIVRNYESELAGNLEHFDLFWFKIKFNEWMDRDLSDEEIDNEKFIIYNILKYGN